LRVEFKAVGDTVNLASRMEGLAEPGTTYVSGEMFKLTEGLFRFEGLGERRVKGKEEPVSVYRVIAPSSRRTRFDVAAERGLTPFVGRERELELLLDAFERAKEGRGQAVSITADPGEGKSRLLYEFLKAIANEAVTFLEGKCLSYSRGVAYHPVVDILKGSCGGSRLLPTRRAHLYVKRLPPTKGGRPRLGSAKCLFAYVPASPLASILAVNALFPVYLKLLSAPVCSSSVALNWVWFCNSGAGNPCTGTFVRWIGFPF
jgi:hypothetical protein